MISMEHLDRKRIDQIIRFALKEDIWTGDITSQGLINRLLDVNAVITAKSGGIVCGVDIAERVFAAVDCTVKFRPLARDGDAVEPDREIAFLEGEAQSILKGERTALNFLSLLSGVATRTKEMTDLVSGTGVKIYDTRKTIPLHRYLQKYAVKVGGGYNHRKGLWDMVLIKDNHLRALGMQLKTSDSETIVKESIKRSRQNAQKNVRIEVEVESVKECEYALEEAPDVIMLDNFSVDMVKKAVELRKEKGLRDKVLLEASGGISRDNVRDYAETGVDMISTGTLTGTPVYMDFGLEVVFSDK